MTTYKKYDYSIYTFYYWSNQADKYNNSPAEPFMYFISWAEVQGVFVDVL